MPAYMLARVVREYIGASAWYVGVHLWGESFPPAIALFLFFRGTWLLLLLFCLFDTEMHFFDSVWSNRVAARRIFFVFAAR